MNDVETLVQVHFVETRSTIPAVDGGIQEDSLSNVHNRVTVLFC